MEKDIIHRGNNGKVSDWLWLIDPLDGTNNYAIGLPAFSLSRVLSSVSKSGLTPGGGGNEG